MQTLKQVSQHSNPSEDVQITMLILHGIEIVKTVYTK